MMTGGGDGGSGGRDASNRFSRRLSTAVGSSSLAHTLLAANGDTTSAAPSEQSRPGRLIVVSNRVSVPNPRNGAAGGLAVALEAALKEHGGIWFGWSGEARPAIDADHVDTQDIGRITFALTDLTKRDVDEYYLGFANRVLWPICHYRLDLASFNAKDALAYFRVNELFARKLAPMVRPGDVIWIHDYHLMPMAAALRERGITNRIGYFHHIPWPPSELASAIPNYGRLLSAMACYDLVGFQTQRDADNFSACMVEHGATEVEPGRFALEDEGFEIDAFPIGIDVAAFREASAKSGGIAAVRRFAATLADQKLVIGVDRLDYSKGIQERIRSFCSFLSTHREERGRVTYLQITPKSRSEVPEYQTIQEDVAQRVGEANGAFGDVDWTPIRYLNQNIGHATLTGLYRLAQVGLVTPLRDGMNLVAKEYVASQAEDDPGVLVLSRYAGAASEMDGAIIVNPYDAVQCASALARAFAMSRGERLERWHSMMTGLEANTVGDWWRRFVDRLHATPEGEAGHQVGGVDLAI